MNGELAQLCALVSHGNAFLSGQCIDPPRLFEANWTFEFVRSVRFEFESGSSGDSTGAWFTALRAGGCQRMSLAIPRGSRAHAAAFSGGVGWHIHTHGGPHPAAWAGRWAADDEPNERPWDVSYVTFPCGGDHTETPFPLAKAHLASALDEAELFDRQVAIGFADDLAQARALLDAPEPTTPVTEDLLPTTGYSLEARQLLACATTGWVFGGMGSWNDFWTDDPEKEERYDEVTRRFYAAVLEAVQSAVNAFQA